MKYQIKNNFRTWSLLTSCFMLVLISTGCKKLVDAKLPTNLVAGSDAYASDATATALLNAIYTNLGTNGVVQGGGSVTSVTGLSGDEFTLYSGITGSSVNTYYNSLSGAVSGNADPNTLWSNYYAYIFRCNDIIAGLQSDAANGMTQVARKQLTGEAKLLRAYFYFNVVNLFGDAVLALGTDADVNRLLGRVSKDVVYAQIIKDLTEARDQLSDNFVGSDLKTITTERVRPTKWAASALLAKVYLYTNKNDLAEAEASLVINNTSLFGPLPSLNNAFLKNSKEAIWQLQPTDLNFNTYEARFFTISSTGPNGLNTQYLSPQQLASFQSGDQRGVNGNWVNSVTVSGVTYTYPYKYKESTSNAAITAATGTTNMKEYFMMFRLGEQYLIRAEARAQLNNIPGAQADLNTIRSRASLAATTATTQTTLLTAILNERQCELFAEGGNRWFDLKRTGKIDPVMTVVTPIKSNGTVTWQPYQALYPILLTEIQRAPNLTQNPGY